MLKKISPIIGPELLKVLCEMGHGDDIVIADGNFPAASKAQRLIRMDGHNVPDILDGILSLFPLDTYVDKPAGVMKVVPGDKELPTIWDEFKEIILKNQEPFEDFEYIEKFEFYKRSEKAYAVVATSEKSLYANLILKKGVL